MNKPPIILVILLLMSTALKAQDLPVISPPTPETASLLRYSEVPVSRYTGVPNISVPIYTLEGRDLNVPIGISYHAGGHRVTEESTWIGLGWNLQAGGQISRTVRSFPDDRSPNGYIHTSSTVEYVRDVCQGSISGDCAGLTGSPAISQNMDYEPDEFNYSMMGQSGRFMFNQERNSLHPKGRIIQFPDQKAKITPSFDANGHITSWDIIDANGVTYHFDEGNKFANSQTFTRTNGQFSFSPGDDGNSANSYSYIETWVLTSATSPNGDIVTFSYNTPSLSPTNTVYNDQTTINTSEQYLAYQNDPNQTGNTLPDSYTEHYTVTNRRYKVLSRITTSKGYVDFVQSATNRLDTESQKKSLQYIRVYDNNNTLIQDIEFIQDYFTGTIAPNAEYVASLPTGSSGINSFLNKRLYLKELVFNGKYDLSNNTNESFRYQFNYHTDELLPHKRSRAQDHWGFYNGANSNTTLIPQIDPQDYGAPFNTPTFGSAIRDCNPTYSKACVLEEIIYPEGGKTVFEFENNEINSVGSTDLYIGGLRVKSLKTYSGFKLVSHKSFDYQDGMVVTMPNYVSYTTGYVIKYHSNSWIPLLTTQSGYVGYKKVFETQHSKASSLPTLQNNYLGHANVLEPQHSRTTEYEFSPPNGSANPITPYVLDWTGGILKSQNVANKKEVTLTDVRFTNTTTDKILGFLMSPQYINAPVSLANGSGISLSDAVTCMNTGICDISAGLYELWPGLSLPSQTVTTLYEGATPMTTTEQIYYESVPHHYYPTKTETTNSNNETITSKTRYPYDENHTDLLNKNMLAVPLRTTSFNNNSVLSTMFNSYDNFNGNLLPKSVKTAKGGNAVLEDRVEFINYTSYGQPREVKKTDGISITYVWGYNYNYPVAKVINATQSEVASLINEQSIQSLSGDALHNALDALRTGLPNAQVETYSYIPLIGLDQQRDMRSRRSYFHYDALGRLKYMVDEEGKVLSENKYNYASN